MILTTYLTGQPDPCHVNTVHLPDDYSTHMKYWYPSMLRSGLNGVIFYDTCTKTFVDRYQTDKIRFVRVPTSNQYSVNDYRFFVFRDWLRANPVSWAFTSDLFDMWINKSPEFMFCESYKLWIGNERYKARHKTWGGCRWMRPKIWKCYGVIPNEQWHWPILAAAMIGAPYDRLMVALDLICTEIAYVRSRPDTDHNCNMPAVNMAILRDIGRKNIWAEGWPLHNPLCESVRQSDYNPDGPCFLHLHRHLCHANPPQGSPQDLGSRHNLQSNASDRYQRVRLRRGKSLVR